MRGQTSALVDGCQARLSTLTGVRFPLGTRSSADALATYRNAVDAFLALEEERISLL